MLKFLPRSLVLSLASLFSFASPMLAHEEEVVGHDEVKEVIAPTLEDVVRTNSVRVVLLAVAIIIFFVLLTILLKDRGERIKKFLFAGIVIPTLLATIFMVGATIRLNLASSSGGPVHWHADFEIYKCGEKLDLVDPEGFSNKVGTSTFHEHNDGRIHVEGVVVDPKEASLGRFFGFVGGELHDDGFEVPTNKGEVDIHNGDPCPDGSSGTLQVFVYKTEGKVFTQEKLEEPTSYVLSPYGNVPPGDCIIVEFDSNFKDKTDKLCDSYKLQIIKGNLYGD